MTKLLKPWAAVLAAAIVLGGCGSQTRDTGNAPTATSDRPTTPGSKPTPTRAPFTSSVPFSKAHPVPPGQSTPEVVWTRRTLLVTAFGSSLCEPVAEQATTVDTQTLLIHFDSGKAGLQCTDDYAPHQSEIPAPTGDIDLTRDVHAILDMGGTARQLVPVHLVHPRFS